jgi:Flp pilus assembly protein TadB
MPYNRIDDEAVLRDVRHPEHTSGWREALTAAVVVWGVGAILLSSVRVEWLSSYVKTILVIFAGTAFGFFFLWWIGGAARRRRSRIDQDVRESIEHETQIRLATMPSQTKK